MLSLKNVSINRPPLHLKTSSQLDEEIWTKRPLIDAVSDRTVANHKQVLAICACPVLHNTVSLTSFGLRPSNGLAASTSYQKPSAPFLGERYMVSASWYTVVSRQGTSQGISAPLIVFVSSVGPTVGEPRARLNFVFSFCLTSLTPSSDSD